MMNKVAMIIKLHAHSIFLACLTVWVGLLPLFEFTGFVDLFELVIVTFVVLSAYYFLSDTNFKSVTRIIAVLCFISIAWTYLYEESILALNSARILLFILLFITTGHFFYRIRHAKEVDRELIVISLATYLLLGIMSAILCYITTVIYPNAYNVSFNTKSPIMDFTYYSFVTMTTLGYGDITPQIPASKSLAVLISLTGQLYVAVVIAMIVGKYISSESDKK